MIGAGADRQLYPALLRQAAEMIEPVVDAAIRNRKRYPYEWAGKWEASVCGANRYDGAGSGVGWHADQLTCTPLSYFHPLPLPSFVVSLDTF
jgi:hypothetical protein